MMMVEKLQAFMDLFGLHARKRGLKTNPLIEQLLKWALSDTGMGPDIYSYRSYTIEEWEYDLLSSLFINKNWEWLRMMVKPEFMDKYRYIGEQLRERAYAVKADIIGMGGLAGGSDGFRVTDGFTTVTTYPANSPYNSQYKESYAAQDQPNVTASQQYSSMYQNSIRDYQNQINIENQNLIKYQNRQAGWAWLEKNKPTEPVLPTVETDPLTSAPRKIEI